MIDQIARSANASPTSGMRENPSTPAHLGRVNPPTCRIRPGGTANAAHAAMTRALLVAAFLVGTASVASADLPVKFGGYAGLGLGPSGHIANFKDGVTNVAPAGRSGAVFAGLKFKGAPIISRFSIEGSLVFNSFIVNNGIDYDARMLGIAARYNHPLGGGMDVYGKLGVAYTTYNSNPQYDAAGTQALIAVGAEYHLPTAVQLSVLVDYTIYTGEIDGSGIEAFSSNERFWKLGFTIGF
jgi:hypothetical protein